MTDLGKQRRRIDLTRMCWNKILDSLSENETYSHKIEEIVIAWEPEE